MAMNIKSKASMAENHEIQVRASDPAIFIDQFDNNVSIVLDIWEIWVLCHRQKQAGTPPIRIYD